MRKLIISMLFCLYAANASALGSFSRACQLSSIPYPLDAPAMWLLYFVGASYSDTLIAPPNQRKTEWVLESITVDWGESRYWLIALSAVYVENHYANTISLWTSRTGPWSADAWDLSIVNDPRVNSYIFNNKLLGFSSRAGAKQIIEVEGRVTGGQLEIPSIQTSSGTFLADFRVEGLHYYYNPSTRQTTLQNHSYAWDCNLDQWGLEWQ